MRTDVPADRSTFALWLEMISARAMWSAAVELRFPPAMVAKDWGRYQAALAALVEAEAPLHEQQEHSRDAIVRRLQEHCR